jgi:2-polyprenyl-3-methyl-5-hydroxy-6-metoxy-1,4-benzoquinol methylase
VSVDPGDLDAATGYRQDSPFHDENLLMLGWYAARLERTLRLRRARRVLSLGIGHQVVSRRVAGLVGSGIDEYTIVEGSSARIEELRGGGALGSGVEVVHGYFEDYVPPGPVDVVEMGFVLEHVADPALVVRRYAGFLAPRGLTAIAVPNARSLHRLVGQRAGLLDDLYRLSEDDLALGHRRYFDKDQLVALVEDAGLRVTACEGILLKCLTTSQLRRLGLDARVMEAFCGIAEGYPDIANALYLEASH